MYEIIFEKIPYFEIKNCSIALNVVLNEEFRPTINEELIQNEKEKQEKRENEKININFLEFIKIMKECWQKEHKNRPTFRKLVSIFAQKLNEFEKPFISQDNSIILNINEIQTTNSNNDSENSIQTFNSNNINSINSNNDSSININSNNTNSDSSNSININSNSRNNDSSIISIIPIN